MRVQCTDSKTFELMDGSEKLGKVNYDSLFSYKAHIIIGDDEYQITPKGFFSTTNVVTKNGAEVANMQMNWKGHIILSFATGQEFILKPTGTFMSKYVVEDKDQQKFILFDPDFNWSKFTYNYNVTFDNKPQNILLVLLATYAANYYMAMMAGTI